MDYNHLYSINSNLINHQQNALFVNSNLMHSNNYTVPSNIPHNSSTGDVLRYLNPIPFSSPTSIEFSQWESLPSSPKEMSDNNNAGDINNNINTIEPLINKTPSSRALKAKRCPTNKCECGGKTGCTKEGCMKSIGCHECPVCGLEFSRKNSMRRHVLTHINLRPYHCKDCDKSFYRSDIYKRHLVSKRCRRNATNNHFLALCQQLPKHQSFNYL